MKTKRRVAVVIGMCGSSLRNLSSECGTQLVCGLGCGCVRDRRTWVGGNHRVLFISLSLLSCVCCVFL